MSNDKQFEMPRPELGEVVWYWRHGIRTGSAQPCIALSINPRTVLLKSLHTNSFFDGIRHADDPMLMVGEQSKQGSWDFTNHGKLIRKIQDELGVRFEGEPESFSRVVEPPKVEPTAPKSKKEKQEPVPAAS